MKPHKKKLRADGVPAAAAALGTAVVVSMIDTGPVIRQAGLRALHARQVQAAQATAAAVWQRSTKALAFVVPYLDSSSIAALSEAGRTGHAAASAFALPGEPSHQVNADASLVLRRVRVLERHFAGVIACSGNFSVRCVLARRLAYVAAMVDLARHMWRLCGAVAVLLPPAATAFVETYWGNHALTLTDAQVAVLQPCDIVPSVLDAILRPGSDVKPVPLAKVSEWMCTWHRTTEAALEAKAKTRQRQAVVAIGTKRPRQPRTTLRVYCLVDQPWLQHHVYKEEVVAVTDARWPGCTLFVHGKARACVRARVQKK